MYTSQFAGKMGWRLKNKGVAKARGTVFWRLKHKCGAKCSAIQGSKGGWNGRKLSGNDKLSRLGGTRVNNCTVLIFNCSILFS